MGPQSAGADPGPVCYGKGTGLTVTDANLYLGRLHPDWFLGGQMQLDVARARDAVTAFAHQVHMAPEAASEGILEVVNANMEGAIRVISVERGHDPGQQPDHARRILRRPHIEGEAADVLVLPVGIEEERRRRRIACCKPFATSSRQSPGTHAPSAIT